jgi:protoheme IX farnesyltransferase
MTGLLGFVLIALFVLVRRDFVKEHRLRRAVFAAGILLIIESLLGASLVLFGWVEFDASIARLIVVPLHLVNTFLLVGAMTLVAFFASGGRGFHIDAGKRRDQLVLAGLGIVLLIGATGALNALADTLIQSEALADAVPGEVQVTEPVLRQIRSIHPFVAILGGLSLYMMVRYLATGATGVVRWLALGIQGIVWVQFVVGLLNIRPARRPSSRGNGGRHNKHPRPSSSRVCMTNSAVHITNPRSDTPVIKTYVELMKLRIIELLLITTLPAMVAAAGGWPGWWLAFATLFGGTLSSAGANAINQVIDRDIDGVMSRTRGRPLPTERVSARAVLIFGATLGVIGFVWLWATTNLLAATLSTVGLLFYVLVYSILLKRTTTQNIVIGGAAGAVPVLVGWAAVTNTLELPAWIMFAIVFYWTPPHFWALAIRYREDYERAGVPMLPVVIGEKRAMDHMLAYTIALVGVTLLLYATGPVGWVYLVVAAASGLAFLGATWRLRDHPGAAMKYFGYSNVYLSVIFLSIAIDVLVLA